VTTMDAFQRYTLPDERNRNRAEILGEQLSYSLPTHLARNVRAGWYMPGVGVIDQVTTHLNGTVTFRGPSSHRTFSLDALVQASEHPSDESLY
jgi:hypothetical protein